MENGEIYNHRELSAESAASLYRDTSAMSVAATTISLLNPVNTSGTPKVSHASVLLEATRTRVCIPAPVMYYSSPIRITRAPKQHATHRILVLQPIPELFPISLVLFIFARHKLDPGAWSTRLQCSQKFNTGLIVIEFARRRGRCF